MEFIVFVTITNISHLQAPKIRPIALAILAGCLGQTVSVKATDFSWSHDFKTGSLTDDWNFNTNNQAVVSFDYYAPSGTEIAHISKGGKTVFHSAAIHETSYTLGNNDSLNMNLAWAPFETQTSAGTNNQVFQFGVLNLEKNWKETTNTFANGDGFWVSGREVGSTSHSKPNVWGTETLDLWIHTDQASSANPFTAKYLGQISFNSFREGAEGSISTTFLDLNLEVGIKSAGNFEYSLSIDTYEYTLTKGISSWVDQGRIFSAKGSRSHDLARTSSLHPTFGYIVADSSDEGATASYWSNVPTPVPEPGTAGLMALALTLLARRRRAPKEHTPTV